MEPRLEEKIAKHMVKCVGLVYIKNSCKSIIRSQVP